MLCVCALAQTWCVHTGGVARSLVRPVGLWVEPAEQSSAPRRGQQAAVTGSALSGLLVSHWMTVKMFPVSLHEDKVVRASVDIAQMYTFEWFSERFLEKEFMGRRVYTS